MSSRVRTSHVTPISTSLTSLQSSKFPDNPEATRAFQKVSVAYDILSKPSPKRMYDSRSTKAPFDFFASRTFQAEETFRGVVLGVINDMLDGDLEMVRTLLCECQSFFCQRADILRQSRQSPSTT